MTLPPWIEPKVTFGNILTILTLIGGLVAAAQAYGALGLQVEANKTDIVDLRAVDASLRLVDEAIRDAANSDRLYVRETLAEIKVDLGYLRRAAEGKQREAVRP